MKEKDNEESKLEPLRIEKNELQNKCKEISTKKRQDLYAKDATIRKLEKQTEKLQQEVNALRIIISGLSPSNNDKRVSSQLSSTPKSQQEPFHLRMD